MHARVTTGEIRPGKEAEAIRLVRETTLPMARSQPGYRGLLGLLDWATGKTMILSLWETAAGRVAGEASGQIQMQQAGIAAVMAGPTTQETFTVEILETALGTAVAARVLTVRLDPPVIDESVAVAREAIRSVSRQQLGFRGALVLVDRSLGRDCAVSLWETDADPQAGEQTSYAREQLARVGRSLGRPVTREAFEVIVDDLPSSIQSSLTSVTRRRDRLAPARLLTRSSASGRR